MKILLLTTYFRPDVAATGAVMTRLAEELLRLGHHITVVTTMPHYDIDRIWNEYWGRLVRHERYGEIEVYRLRVYVPAHRGRFLGLALSYATFNFLSLVTGLLAGRSDIILAISPPLTNGISADLIGRVQRIPFVYNVQDIWPDALVRAGLVTRPSVIAAIRGLERHVYHRASALVVLSEGFRRNLLGKGISPSKIQVIPNLVETDVVRPLDKRNRFGAAHGLDGKFVVLFAGNLGYTQGLDTVLDAAQQLTDCDAILFLIVGSGASRSQTEAYAQRLRLPNVRFLPFQPHEAVPEMYAACDVCLVPMRRGFTNVSVPHKVFTIMASGRPMVAALDKGSDIRQLIERAQCGLCVEPEDAHALADAIRMLYADGVLRARLGRNGREHVVQGYTPDTVARQYHELLTSVAGLRE